MWSFLIGKYYDSAFNLNTIQNTQVPDVRCEFCHDWMFGFAKTAHTYVLLSMYTHIRAICIIRLFVDF